jgi:hypothetical protein
VVNHALDRHRAGGGISTERKPDNSVFSDTCGFAQPSHPAICGAATDTTGKFRANCSGFALGLAETLE